MTADEIQAFQIHSMALGQLVNNAVFENEFDKQQFIVDETVVASETKKDFLIYTIQITNLMKRRLMHSYQNKV